MEKNLGKYVCCGMIYCLLMGFASSGNCQAQPREWKLMEQISDFVAL